MKNKRQLQANGFTLIEMLLVLVIVSMIIYLAVGYIEQRTLQARMDRTSLQMQQILNAGLAYYVANGSWPPDPAITNLQGTYLPPASVPLPSPWGQNPGYVAVGATAGAAGAQAAQFYVYTLVTAGAATTAAANIIAGKLPMAYTTSAAPSGNNPPAAGTPCPTTVPSSGTMPGCYVVASVNIPGQNLNNAPAVNFSGVYKHGGCVPVPTCPVDKNGNTMVPQIFVAPVSVSGVNDASPSTATYPITSFTAYAKGDGITNNPEACFPGGEQPTCSTGAVGTAAAYWRVCLQVITERGNVNVTNTGTSSSSWGQFVTLMAITRCAIQNEPSGSTFSVFSN